MLVLIVALVALLVAGVGQVQNRSLRARVGELQFAAVNLTEQQRQQAEHDFETLVRIVAKDDQAADTWRDIDASALVEEAERYLRHDTDGAA